MSAVKNKRWERDFITVKTAMMTNGRKICPVCGKETGTRYFDEVKKQYAYKHKTLYRETIYHYANQ